MAKGKIDIFVYAHWKGMKVPELMGILSAHFAKGKKAFGFEYDKNWLKSKEQQLIDPDIQFYSGVQFPNQKENFGIFLDSMPDTWGKTMMKRREAQEARKNNKKSKKLYEIDYLLRVYDDSRMGALRFKTEPDGVFLDQNELNPTPPWTSVSQLQSAVNELESSEDNSIATNWLSVLYAPGSSLGGARPKANILDKNKDLWIAKFPSKNDTIDKAGWEFLAYKLAISSGINMSACKIQKIANPFNTFFTKRFDRVGGERIHFASAMTMTGQNENTIKENPGSYLDLAEFIQNYGCNIDENLSQLWRRIIFNIAISNTDDHLRNHGFVLTKEGWQLSPAYDLNPSIDKPGLALNIDLDNNDLDYNLAKDIGIYFRLNKEKMDQIIDDITTVVSHWKCIASDIGISNKEISMMEPAFNLN